MTTKALRAVDVLFGMITGIFKKMFMIVILTALLASLLTVVFISLASHWL